MMMTLAVKDISFNIKQLIKEQPEKIRLEWNSKPSLLHQ